MIDEIKLLKVDNELNERFLRKNDPELLNGIMAATLETEKRKTKIQFAESVQKTENENTVAVVPQSGNSSEISRNASVGESFGTRSRAASTTSSADIRAGRPHMNLSFVIKSEICENECILERTDLNTFEHNMRAQFCELLADVEEIKLTTKDILYATEMFKDFVVRKGRIIFYDFLRVKDLLRTRIAIHNICLDLVFNSYS